MSLLKRFVPVGLAAFAAAALVAPSGCAQSSTPPAPSIPSEQQPRVDALRKLGAQAPLAVLPALLMGRPNRDVGDAVGLVLEQQAGLDAVQSANGTFAPPADATAEQLPALLAAHLLANPSGADHTLLASFEVKERKFVAVRTWIVDGAGALLFADLQQAGDAAFDRVKPDEPMECCLVVAERVRALLQLPARKGDRDGPMKQWWAAKSNLPPAAERDAMGPRLAAFRAAGKAAKVAVLPVRVSGTADAAQAELLAKALSAQCSATASSREFPLDAAPTSNQQLRLWTVAKALRAELQLRPIDADYVLLADYVTSADHAQVGGVQLVLCTGKGEWVAVDLQNDHHADFQAVAPKDLAGCTELAKRRIARLQE
ncbi:MAG: hypothetical protein JNL90_00935 [Planctomycetes bacterium]|nr:hypothetical protein [Planctomycetota bacterium]